MAAPRLRPVILLLLGLSAAGMAVSSSWDESPAADVPISFDKRAALLPDYLKFKGDPKAQYLLVEFADYQCPHCREASVMVDKLMKDGGPKPVRLDEHRDKVSHFLEPDPRAQVPQRLLPAQPRSQFKR